MAKVRAMKGMSEIAMMHKYSSRDVLKPQQKWESGEKSTCSKARKLWE